MRTSRPISISSVAAASSPLKTSGDVVRTLTPVVMVSV
ncbi:Uncharacterised protein [Mycobacteroides abscessus subsp. abscessus]|nr:Uncharacterised protein [Mycobacteroides abscessus subsp. abscessus]